MADRNKPSENDLFIMLSRVRTSSCEQCFAILEENPPIPHEALGLRALIMSFTSLQDVGVEMSGDWQGVVFDML